MKILLLENIHPIAKETLESQGFIVELHKPSYGEDELKKMLKDFHVVGIRSKTQMTASVIADNPHLLAIGCFCIGTNQVNLEMAREAGIPVFNAPYSNTRSVAELVLCEIVALSRKLSDLSAQVHQGHWEKSAANSYEVRGKTLGIVGYGHIGSQVSILAEAFGMKVVYYDIIKKLPLGNSVACSSLDELLSESDFVTLHVPETEETKNMITAKELSKMKVGSYLLNLSRGTVVDIPALAESLKSGHLKGAAVDVYPSEPKGNSGGFQSPLQTCPNVILTPHVGGSTQEAQKSIGLEVADTLTSYILSGQTLGAVGFPNIQPSTEIRGNRLLNIHQNVPGVLGDINSIVSAAGINIHSQFLATDEKIGYLIMDIEKGHQEAFDKISKLKTSIKTRLL
ncbi:MAG: phosphoglycerate dehydrogenase [Bdellovibrionales bacterium]|nr:phosphoglycerate dehydrogenase [Bdellovibrionales bacterium]